MKTTFVLSLLITALSWNTHGQGTAFTYQGRLIDNGNPANGNYDLRVALYDALTGINAAGGPLTNSSVAVSNGLFTVALDFGAGIFDGRERWLEIGVRTNGSPGEFVLLTPRQLLTPAPYALYTPSAGVASNALTASTATSATTAGAVPWTGITGRPPGLDDGDGDTTYSAGAGLTLSGTQFNVNFSGSGSNPTAARSDHAHSFSQLTGTAADNQLSPNVALLNRAAQIFSGGISAPQFSGNGAGLSNLNAASIASGTLADARLSANIARLDVPNTSTQATGTPTVTSGFITGASVTSGGSGYSAPPAVTINDTSGSGALITANVSGGMVTSLTVQNAGSGYSPGATLTIEPPPSNAYQVFASTNYFSGINTLTNPANVIAGNGAALTSLNASQLTSGTVSDAQLPPNLARTTQVWLVGGNAGTTPALNFLGTTDDRPLALKVRGQFALRLEPATNAAFGFSPNVIAGFPGNTIEPGSVGSVIGGGGRLGLEHRIAADHATIGGGDRHTVTADNGTIAGGGGNIVRSSYSFVGGGLFNTIETNINSNASATIGGGSFNSIRTNADQATIAGGNFNTIHPNTQMGTIGGGTGNIIQPGTAYGTIGGGANNIASVGPSPTVAGGQGNTAGGHYTAVGGGLNNTAIGYTSSIGGGGGNVIETNADHAVISGGLNNRIRSLSFRASIGGGENNVIQTNADWSTIAGGVNNRVFDNTSYGTIAGGFSNEIGTNSHRSSIGGGENNDIGSDSGTIAGGNNNSIRTNSNLGAIGGGSFNRIAPDSQSSAISGGSNNNIGTNSSASAIGGGQQNSIGNTAANSTIGGGVGNRVGTNSPNSTISGGFFNEIGTNSGTAVIGGGWDNDIGENSSFSTIGGGINHNIGTNASSSVIAGGSGNAIGASSFSSTIAGGAGNNIGTNSSNSTIGGGNGNRIGTNAPNTTIGGGVQNTIASNVVYATIPGGFGNYAGGIYSFAAGNRAQANHSGTFAWAGGNTLAYPSAFANSFNVYAAGGVSFDYGAQTAPNPRGASWVYIGPTSTVHPNSTISTWTGAFLSNSGVWTSVSDKNRKTDFEEVDAREILDRVASMPVRQWRYTNESAGIKHVGPTAQDFKTTFGLGTDDKTIGAIDADGIALAAIQGLNQKLEEQLRKKEAEIEALKDRMASFEKIIARLGHSGAE